MTSVRGALLAAALSAAAASAAAAQLADRVRDVGDGIVRIGYDARPDVEVCDQGIRIGDRHVMWRSRGWGEASNCRLGWIEVELEVREGEVHDVELVRGLDDRSPRAVEVGRVPAREVADYLLGLASSSGSRRVAREAVAPAVLADVDEIWLDLLVLSRHAEAPREARKSALFWLGQEAADAATEGLAEIAADEEEAQEIRDAAVFALSQRPRQEGVPILMELARTAREPDTRRSALFWLAQSDDPRVVDFFEQILLRRRPGG